MMLPGNGIVENIFDYNIAIRILAAVCYGFILGLERALTNKYAGLRTHILVCLGACIFTIISIYGFPTVLTAEDANGIRDTGRVAAQVVSGIGFIGAGAVLRNGPMIFGLTTAATLWIAAAIGMACGAGLLTIGMATTIFAVAVLTLIRIFEKQFLPSGTRRIKKYNITIYCEAKDEEPIKDFLDKKFDLINFSIKRTSLQENKIKLNATVEIKKNDKITSLYDDLKQFSNIESASILEVND